MEHLSKDTPLTNSISGCEQQLFLHFPGAPSLNLLRTPVLSANSGQTLLTTQFITESSGSQGGRPSSLAEPASYQVCKKIKPFLHQKIWNVYFVPRVCLFTCMCVVLVIYKHKCIFFSSIFVIFWTEFNVHVIRKKFVEVFLQLKTSDWLFLTFDSVTVDSSYTGLCARNFYISGHFGNAAVFWPAGWHRCSVLNRSHSWHLSS